MKKTVWCIAIIVAVFQAAPTWAAAVVHRLPPLVADALAAHPAPVAHARVTDAVAPAWINIMSEDFNGAWPGEWFVSPMGGADCYWGDVSCFFYNDTWSAHCADDGSMSSSQDCFGYVNNMETWMIYGPFSLADMVDGYMDFYYFTELEDTYDSFIYGMSVDGNSFYGNEVTIDTPDWTYGMLNFGSIPAYGSMLGAPEVWMGFVFRSDANVIEGQGVYVDYIDIQVEMSSDAYVRLSMPASQYSPGDWFYLNTTFASAVALNAVPLFVILDVYGSYYMGPSFTGYDNYLVDSWNSPQTFNVLDFTWPSGAGSASGLLFHCALTDPGVNFLISNLETKTFGFFE
ncbi:hypothetical protein JW905_11105 [bacterium]|nr:hypothetical protein [candidate division CSSED10-310 bacterium]